MVLHANDEPRRNGPRDETVQEMGDVRTAAGIVAHRPEDVKKPGMPAAMSAGPRGRTGQPGCGFGRSRAAGGTFFGKTVLFYLN